jgi:hypothetical protein
MFKSTIQLVFHLPIVLVLVCLNPKVIVSLITNQLINGLTENFWSGGTYMLCISGGPTSHFS